MNTYLVSDVERDRAVAHLQACYANGSLDEVELDRRLDAALAARDRAELNRSLQGLARVAPQRSPMIPPVRRPGSSTSAENLGGGVVQLSGLFTWAIGPAITKAVATPGSRVWWEASRALSLQLTAGIVGLAAFGIAVVLGLEGLFFLAWAAWFFGTIWASVRAFNGKPGTGALEPLLVGREQPMRGALPYTR